MHHVKSKLLFVIFILLSLVGFAKFEPFQLSILVDQTDSVAFNRTPPKMENINYSSKYGLLNTLSSAKNCDTVKVPFWEGFNTSSLTLDCWKTINSNPKITTNWDTYTYDPFGMWEMFFSNGNYEGDQAMAYVNLETTEVNDAWLISPSILLDKNKVYRLQYEYRVLSPFEDPNAATSKNEFEVLLSSSNPNILSNFTEVVVAKTTYKNDTFLKKTTFIKGNNKYINLAWHITTTGDTGIHFDNISIEEVTNCPEPLDLLVTAIEQQKATISWTDDYNSQWEYIVQNLNDPAPSASSTGIVTTSKSNTITLDKNKDLLSSNTSYAFYVRARCSTTTPTNWSEPEIFTTDCDTLGLPFAESFDTDSTTLSCWKIVNVNNDALILPDWLGLGSMKIWCKLFNATEAHNGDQAMRYFVGTASTANPPNDWLISPSFVLDSTKTYALKFFYKNYASAEMEILASTSGSTVSHFTHSIAKKKLYQSTGYKEEIIYFTNISGTTHIGWHVTDGEDIFIDTMSLEEVACPSPSFPTIQSRKTDEITIQWIDNQNEEWEYVVKDLSSVTIPANGTKTTSTSVSIKEDMNGVPLQPSNDYEFYIRSNCSSTENSEWIGPLVFIMPCTSITVPYTENFSTSSATLFCWSILDANNDSRIDPYSNSLFNAWKIIEKKLEEGGQGSYFFGEFGRKHDDWLISPMVKFTGGLYAITYSYMTNNFDGPEDFEIALSKEGIDLTKFTTIIQPTASHNTFGKYVKKTIYVKGINDDVNIGWHITSLKNSNNSYLAINYVSIEEIDCVPVDPAISIDEIQSTTFSFSWNDDYNTAWEYYVSPGGAPTGSGTATTKKNATVSTDSRGNPITPDTYYEVYVRSNCTKGKFSKWIGPIEIHTLCNLYTIPFWEGFNSSSPSYTCWRSIDLANDGYKWLMPPRTVNKWGTYIYEKYEGDLTASFFGENKKHNDWFISPTIKFEGKKYVITYYYKTGTNATASGSTSRTELENNTHEVLLSTKGIGLKNFTTVLAPMTTYRSQEYVQKAIFVENLTANVNLAWHVEMEGETILLLDNLTIEEVACIPPTPTIQLTDESTNSVKIDWKNNLNSWEYYIQTVGITPPSATDAGKVSNTTTVTATSLPNGSTLTAGTTYDVYVRSICSDGTKSIWLGPFTFKTLCNEFTIPFKEGFNSQYWKYKSESLGCWTILDANNDGVTWAPYSYNSYEGDQNMHIINDYDTTNDDWLISPTLVFDGSAYILKYHYAASQFSSTDLEVLLSTTGTKPSDFKQVILPKKTYKKDNYIEEIIYLNGIKGKVNIAWHVTTKGRTNFYLDNISIDKNEPCPQPTNITRTKQGANSLDIQWTPGGTETDWEIYVQEFGPNQPDINTTPTQIVTGAPNTTINGLKPGVPYQIYVRSKCNVSNVSTWSTPYLFSIASNINSDCLGAIEIPVNPNSQCIQYISSSTKGATPSTIPLAPCSIFKTDGYLAELWYEFTATNTTHMLSIEGHNVMQSSMIELSMYEVDCQSINPSTPANCNFLQGFYTPYVFVNDLIVGQKYILRLGFNSRIYINETYFNLCITTPDPSITVSPSNKPASVSQIISQSLIQAECDIISNVKATFGADNKVNGLASFTKNKSILPFEEGIILTTHDVEKSNKPRTLSNDLKNKVTASVGDPDINRFLKQLNSDKHKDVKYTSTVEFDLIAVTDSLQFDYLFATDASSLHCDYRCVNGAAMAAILVTDLTTNVTTNIATIPHTDVPISTSTIRDNTGYSSLNQPDCPTVSPQYQWKNYSYSIDNPFEAPIDYNTLSIALKTKAYPTVIGHKYHIKLGIVDLCNHASHGSALLVNKATFGNLPQIDLGEDRLIEENNGLCSTEQYTIHSNLSAYHATDQLNVNITWYKDGILLNNEIKDSLVVKETGTYEVKMQLPDLGCETTQSVRIEFYPTLEQQLQKPQDQYICRYATIETSFDLTAVTSEMFRTTTISPDNYEIMYFSNKKEEPAIQKPATYLLPIQRKEEVIYIHTKDKKTGCEEWFEFKLIPQAGDRPNPLPDVAVCATYTLPLTANNQLYYTAPAGKGTAYKGGDQLTPGKYTLYLLQDNGNNCYEETSFLVEVFQPLDLFTIEDQVIQCDIFYLPELPSYHTYSIEIEGKRVELQPKTPIYDNQVKIYITAESPNKICKEETSFIVQYEECPIPKGFSPNEDGINDRFDLSQHGVTKLQVYNRNGVEVYSFTGQYTNQWDGKSKNGKVLPSGTYYYVIQAFNKTRTGWVAIQK